MFTPTLLHAADASAPWQLPPLHPVLVNFTAALIPTSFVFDVLGRATRKESLRTAAWWTLLFAAVVTPFTAIAGWLWLRSMADMDHPQMAIHRWLGTGLAVTVVPFALWRGWLYRRGTAPGWRYLLSAVVVLAALVYQGDLGGTMSFGGGGGGAAESRAPHDHASLTTSPADSNDHSKSEGSGSQALRPGWNDHIDVP